MAGVVGVRIVAAAPFPLEEEREYEWEWEWECRGGRAGGAGEVGFLLMESGRGGNGRFLSQGGDGDLDPAVDEVADDDAHEALSAAAEGGGVGPGSYTGGGTKDVFLPPNCPLPLLPLLPLPPASNAACKSLAYLS